MNVRTLSRDQIVPLNARGRTTRTGRVPAGVLRFAVLPETTGQRIRRLRLASGRSIRQLAADAGVARMVVMGAEQDRSILLHTFVAIAEALGVGLDELWSGRSA